MVTVYNVKNTVNGKFFVIEDRDNKFVVFACGIGGSTYELTAMPYANEKDKEIVKGLLFQYMEVVSTYQY